MSRAYLLQPILNLFSDPSYLEIGVFQGETFLSLDARTRVGVDVHFQFDTEEALKAQGVELHQVPSDIYFSRVEGVKPLFDVIFIDGMHEYNQTLRDLLNSITRLKPDGVIVVDDVVPTSYAASLPDPGLVHEVKAATGSSESAWMGDAYKIPFFVRSFLPQFSYATVLGGRELIMWSGPRREFQTATTEWIERRDFSDTVRGASVYNYTHQDEILKALGRHRGRSV